MNMISTESGSQEVVNDDAPDEFDLAMDSFATDDKPPADMAAGEGGADRDESNKVDTPLGSSEAGVIPQAAGAAPPAVDQSTNDIWANAPPELRDAYDSLNRDYEYKLSAAKGRLSAADRELARLRSEQNRQAEPPQVNEQASTETDPFNPEKMNNLREEYGDVAGPLVDMIEALKGRLDHISGTVGQVEQERQAAQSNAQIEFLASKHPDWANAYTDERFRGWYEQQPEFIRSAVERNGDSIVDGQEAAHILDLFKRDIGAAATPPQSQSEQDQNASRLSDKRQRQLDAGRDAASRGGPSAAAGVPDDYETAMDYFAAQADRGRKR